MFGWGPGLALPSASSEPEKERNPPSNPTPLDFPEYNLPEVVPNEADSALPHLYGMLAGIKRPQDITLDRFKPLNVQVETNVEVHRMFPTDQTRSLPPLPWELGSDSQNTSSNKESEDEEEATHPTMSNGSPYPPKERYETLRRELALDNEDTFREVARLPPREGRSRVRVTQTRKFWTGLEHVAQYWDTSLDNYYERPVTPPSTAAGYEFMDPLDDLADLGEPGPTEPAMDVDQDADGDHTSSDPEQASHPSVKKYTGRRVGAGSEMPDEMRDETIRGFVEMIAWPFGCQVTAPTLPPRLTIQNLLFPVRQSFYAARSPRDRTVARSGILEGPVLIGQCRSETAFRAPGEAPGSGRGELCDLFREVGGMLLAAQERAREGELEQRPGEGKWWTTIPRFGGAPNGGILDDLVRSAHGLPLSDSILEEHATKPSSPMEELEGSRKRHKFEHPFMTSLARRPSAMRKMSSSEKWKILQPGPSLWDRRMRYMRIGKARESLYDDIYMISAINHHISILHLRVHQRYLDILTNGTSNIPADSDPDQPWHVLKLQRTRWYDLLNGPDRVEALQSVWTLFHYQLRPT
ncbi:hypothetical protein N7539_005358 [Penicillium diatomitis]|uniref:Uncharacterized protein n=1 Tax=Penicillium diatomitis TaxID=2819901 RepID=A0A9X0BV75_9EURO|nr:uncharacterized protein N7539_005358 [Penicillium diatomitis]KAJ5485370.1 hypothetical protein N7539_005358 [Penicillium diatomitis]